MRITRVRKFRAEDGHVLSPSLRGGIVAKGVGGGARPRRLDSTASNLAGSARPARGPVATPPERPADRRPRGAPPWGHISR